MNEVYIYKCSNEPICKLVSDAYNKGKADAYKELAPLIENITTLENICEAIDDNEWCEANCGNTDKCLARYIEQLKG